MPATRRPLVIGLDVLAVALLAITIVIFSTGGVVFYVAGVRVSLGSSHRALLSLLMVIAVRLVLGRRVGPFGGWTAQWQRMLDTTETEPIVVGAHAARWRRGALAAAGMAAVLVLLLHDQLLNPYGVPDLGDPLFSIWRIGWIAHQIVADPRHLFDANIFYPERLTLTLSDPVIVPAVMAAPLLALGVHPVVAYNILLVAAFWLSGVTTYWLVERLTGSARAAFIAGLIYACCAYRFEHYSHLELQMTLWMPMALLALHLFLSSGRWKYALALGLAGAAQLYSSMYYGTFLLVYAATIAGALLVIYHLRLRPVIVPLMLAAALAGVIALPLARAFTTAQPMRGERQSYEVAFWSARPSDFVRPQRYSVLYSNHELPEAAERSLFPGVAPLALAAVALAPPLGTMRLVYAVGLLVSVDATLGLNGAIYPFLYEWLPPFRGLRVPARFAALVSLTLAILAGFGAYRALRWRVSHAHQGATFGLLVVFVAIDALPTLPLMPVWKEPPVIYDTLKYVPGAVIAETPLASDATSNLPYMYFSLWHWSQLVNGYSGFIPTSYERFYEDMRTFPDDRAIDALRRHGVNYVIVNCGVPDALNEPMKCAALAGDMRRSPQLRLVADTPWMDHTVQLYEVVSP